MTSNTTGNLPEKKFRAGVVSATVWLNQTEKNGKAASYRTISLQRGYKDKNDQWQNTTSFRTNDLPRATLVLNQAYEYLVTQQRNDPTAIIEEEVVM